MTRPHANLRTIVVTAVLAVMAVAAEAHTEAPADFRTLAAHADVIARGHVTDVRGAVLPSGEIVSIATVAVDDALKGDTGSFLSLILPGGEVGRVRAVMPGVPTLRVNDAAVFLLHRGPDNVWRLASLESGLYRLRRDAETGRVVIDPPAVAGQTANSRGAVDRGSVRRRPMTVAEFDALVRLVVQAQVQPIRRGQR